MGYRLTEILVAIMIVFFPVMVKCDAIGGIDPDLTILRGPSRNRAADLLKIEFIIDPPVFAACARRDLAVIRRRGRGTRAEFRRPCMIPSAKARPNADGFRLLCLLTLIGRIAYGAVI